MHYAHREPDVGALTAANLPPEPPLGMVQTFGGEYRLLQIRWKAKAPTATPQAATVRSGALLLVLLRDIGETSGEGCVGTVCESNVPVQRLMCNCYKKKIQIF
tara:strand:+ start:113 stop:421 length:309 start_codon:yes stop_codon:yes gene_type:complete